MNSKPVVEGRKQLSVGERKRYEGYMAEIFGRLGMDLGSEPCKRTPQRWIEAPAAENVWPAPVGKWFLQLA